jgi:hypothetical protein
MFLSTMIFQACASRLETDAILRMPNYQSSGLQNMVVSEGIVGQAPQHLPNRYTDDSILSIPVPTSLAELQAYREAKATKKGFLSKLKSPKKPDYTIVQVSNIIRQL